MKDISLPDYFNEASVIEYFGKIKTRSEMIAEMPDSIIPMDFHLYKIGINDNFLEMEISSHLKYPSIATVKIRAE